MVFTANLIKPNSIMHDVIDRPTIQIGTCDARHVIATQAFLGRNGLTSRRWAATAPRVPMAREASASACVSQNRAPASVIDNSPLFGGRVGFDAEPLRSDRLRGPV